jgi:hypothetical protein
VRQSAARSCWRPNSSNALTPANPLSVPGVRSRPLGCWFSSGLSVCALAHSFAASVLSAIRNSSRDQRLIEPVEWRNSGRGPSFVENLAAWMPKVELVQLQTPITATLGPNQSSSNRLSNS